MNSLQEYADLFYKLNLTELTVVEGDKKLCLKRNQMALADPAPAPEKDVDGHLLGDSDEAKDRSSNDTDTARGTVVKAPLLGMLTLQVSIGDKVKKGDVLCMIEAMKMMNEVVSPADGTVTGILATDGALVEFDQKLLVIS